MSYQNLFTGEMTEKQRLFREKYKRSIAKWYSGWGHLLSIYIPGIAVIGFCIAQIKNPTWTEIFFLLPILLIYNFNEWWIHKNAMHKPVKGFGGALLPVFHRHVQQHHQYFTSKRMTYDSSREWRIVLFPPYALLIFLLGTASMALIIGYLWTPNAGYMLMLSTPFYYLNYETFHLCCHVQENWFVRHCPLINTIRRHHAAHHSHHIMMERNMNLTYPIADWYMRTSDLDRGLIGHLFNGYNQRYIKSEFQSDQGIDFEQTLST
ncbi:fatty acid hydroxylase family protein [Burkholderiales bacterium]|nr:fatty acid hydroxylase family protein [Burkholderiales bacterium]